MAIEIKVKPTKELFFNEDTAFGIYGAEVNPKYLEFVSLNKYGNISLKGVMPRLRLREEYEALVEVDSKSTYDGTYMVKSIRQKRPVTIEEQKHFFSMILTPLQCNSVFNVYEGQDVIKLIENDKFDYTKVYGIGIKTYERMKEKVLSSLDMSELLVFLSKNKIKFNMVSKLLMKYKSPQLVIDKIQKNPYTLTEVNGVGFKKADSIAKAMGYDMKSKNRIESCITFCIEDINKDGHSWISRKSLITKMMDLLSLTRAYIDSVLDEIHNDNIVVVDGRYSTKYIYGCESIIARKLKDFNINSKKIFKDEELDEMINAYCEENSVELEENQRQFFFDWNENPVLFLVGGGGMGKSWLTNILLSFIKTKKLSIALLAPTGRASKVMANYTNHHASTIHRRISNSNNIMEMQKTIEEDVIIIDETSMGDVIVLAKLLMSIANEHARILFIGDDFQLPSVGVGNFLHDALISDNIKVSRLKKTFRQADNGMLNVATNIRNNVHFLNNDEHGKKVFGKDCMFLLVEHDYIYDNIIKSYKNVLKRYKPEDVAVLTPTNKGRLGTVALNKEIQKIVNPPSKSKIEIELGGDDSKVIFRTGDYVMNIANAYNIPTIYDEEVDILNGDNGTIESINIEEKYIVVNFDGSKVKINNSDALSMLRHSWSMTIHKSQGSQYKVVIMVADSSMTYQLNANLLYVGASRATEYELILTQALTFNRAMNKFANMERRNFLCELIELHNHNNEQAFIEQVSNAPQTV